MHALKRHKLAFNVVAFNFCSSKQVRIESISIVARMWLARFMLATSKIREEDRGQCRGRFTKYEDTARS